MAAIDFQLMGDDPRHGNLWRGVICQHQAHLHVATSAPEVGDRIAAGLGMAERVDGDMRAAAGGIAHRLDNIIHVTAVNSDLGAEFPRQRQLVLGNIDRHDTGAQSLADHDGGEADAAAAVHREPLATFNRP